MIMFSMPLIQIFFFFFIHSLFIYFSIRFFDINRLLIIFNVYVCVCVCQKTVSKSNIIYHCSRKKDRTAIRQKKERRNLRITISTLQQCKCDSFSLLLFSSFLRLLRFFFSLTSLLICSLYCIFFTFIIYTIGS